MLDQSTELIDVIDEANQTVATVERRWAYANKKSHRIVHVMVENKGRYFIVKRALSVRYLPGYYCTSAGGHVLAGESFLDAAARELEEEIGLTGSLEHVDTFSFQHDFRVLIALFVLRLSDLSLIKTNEKEVLEGRFFDSRELSELDTGLFHPQLQICLDKTRGYFND